LSLIAIPAYNLGMTKNIKDMSIDQVMTSMPHTVGADQTARVAREMMRQHNIRHLPVQKGGELVGIVSDRDINFALAIDLKRDNELLIDAIYTPEPTTVGPKTKLVGVVKKMHKDQIGCVLVVEKGELVNIYTITDVCRDMFELLDTGKIGR
jgi:acetoin utilization protein AcuB